MKVIKIEKHGCNYIVGFEGGAVRHFCGSEIEKAGFTVESVKQTFSIWFENLIV